jgi:ribosomal protein S27AE
MDNPRSWAAQHRVSHQSGPRVKVAAKCVRCGESYLANRVDARYCSGRCRKAAERAAKRSQTVEAAGG